MGRCSLRTRIFYFIIILIALGGRLNIPRQHYNMNTKIIKNTSDERTYTNSKNQTTLINARNSTKQESLIHTKVSNVELNEREKRRSTVEKKPAAESEVLVIKRVRSMESGKENPDRNERFQTKCTPNTTQNLTEREALTNISKHLIYRI